MKQKSILPKPHPTTGPLPAGRPRRSRLLGALLASSTLALGMLAAGGALRAQKPDIELLPIEGFGEAVPPLPDPSLFPIQLVLDDDQAEAVFGFGGGSARQFLWLNRFDPPNPGGFQLEEIWVLFPAGADVPLGGPVQLVVYEDDDGDSSNGAALVATYDEVIQAADGNTFSVYPIAPVALNGSGDILIGVVNRFFQTGIDPPPTQPAAIDTTTPQARTEVALWAGDAPDPPDLATASTLAPINGNAMIRGFGTGSPVIEVPTLSGAMLLLMSLLLGLFAWRRLQRLRRQS